ncbi:MAG: RdgB/HAM1 family non-canonical purine NTP pyrophosphatase, partial [Candidatus Subteraquimicrobiales bacterium]|nr:RdgB/HAM1 family non-canonical purine NTP pyrophosphatase [Candidatus Subteraquimicrobiales bacterium]
MKVVIATQNLGKIREIKEIINLPGVETLSFLSFSEWSLNHKWPSVQETGKTFEENAVLKAKKFTKEFGLPSLADDSGLEVEVLEGAPGILSARYAGSNSTDEENNAKLLKALEKYPPKKRKARYRCCAALMAPDGKVFIAEGACKGVIGFGPRGSGGFGYDPLFIPEGYDKTMAELSLEEKNR